MVQQVYRAIQNRDRRPHSVTVAVVAESFPQPIPTDEAWADWLHLEVQDGLACVRAGE